MFYWCAVIGICLALGLSAGLFPWRHSDVMYVFLFVQAVVFDGEEQAFQSVMNGKASVMLFLIIFYSTYGTTPVTCSDCLLELGISYTLHSDSL